MGEIQFDAATESHWRRLYSELTAGRPGLLGAILGRAEAYVKRLACVYALLDMSAVVQIPHLEAATALWEYSEASARFVFGESLGDPNAEKLLAALKATPEGLTRDQIGQGVFSGHLGKQPLNQLLQELLSLGLIHRAASDESKPGRKPEVWRAGQDFEAHRPRPSPVSTPQ